MSGNELQEVTLANRNMSFLDAEPKIDQAIQIQQPTRRSMWRTKIARGTFTLMEGMEKKAYRFFPGIGPQRGLHLWHPVQVSRKPSAGDPGYDATKYNPHTVTYGFDSVTYGGKGIEYVTPPISIRDLRFSWQIRDQLMAVYGYLGDFTNDLWENYHREQYIKWCNASSRIFVIGDGRPGSVVAAYDPDSVDTDGDNILTVATASAKIGILDWKWFRHWSRYFEIQAPSAAIAEVDGIPTVGWVGDLEDFDRMIEEDPKLREDWRHHNARVLVENYGSITNYKGFALSHDLFTPRFKIKSSTATTTTLKRVDAKVSSAASLIGFRSDVNDDYLTAEYGMAIVFIKDVFMTEIPPSGPSSPGGGTSFGAAPGLNGMWKWLNIQDAVSNPLNEIGFWFMRGEAWSKPLRWREEPICVIYRRFLHNPAKVADVGQPNVADSRGLAADALTGDVDTTHNMVTVTLDGYLSVESGQAIVLTDDAAATYAGIIAEHDAAPTYVLALHVTAPAFGDLTAAGSSTVEKA